MKLMHNSSLDVRESYIIAEQYPLSSIFYAFDGKDIFKFFVPSAFLSTFNILKGTLHLELRKDAMYGDD